MSDRLEQIRIRRSVASLCGTLDGEAVRADVDWLIGEVQRLHAALDDEKAAHAKTCANFEDTFGLDVPVGPGGIAILANPGAWLVYRLDGDDEPWLWHLCPGSDPDEGELVGKPDDYTLAALLDVAAQHVCEPVDGGAQ